MTTYVFSPFLILYIMPLVAQLAMICNKFGAMFQLQAMIISIVTHHYSPLHYLLSASLGRVRTKSPQNVTRIQWPKNHSGMWVGADAGWEAIVWVQRLPGKNRCDNGCFHSIILSASENPTLNIIPDFRVYKSDFIVYLR